MTNSNSAEYTNYKLVEKEYTQYTTNGVRRETGAESYIIDFERLGFKSISVEPQLRVDTIPKLDGTYAVQHHGLMSRRYKITGNIRVDGIAIVARSRFRRSLREYIAELELKKLQWFAETGTLCTLMRYENGATLLEVESCYVSNGPRIAMSSSVGGIPLLRTWSFEILEVYTPLDENDIFNVPHLPIPGSEEALESVFHYGAGAIQDPTGVYTRNTGIPLGPDDYPVDPDA